MMNMMKSGAPPDKFGVLYCQLPIEFHGFTSRINYKGYHSLVPVLSQFFLETVWVPLNSFVLGGIFLLQHHH